MPALRAGPLALAVMCGHAPPARVTDSPPHVSSVLCGKRGGKQTVVEWLAFGWPVLTGILEQACVCSCGS